MTKDRKSNFSETLEYESFADCYTKEWVVKINNYHEDQIRFWFDVANCVGDCTFRYE